MGLDAANELLEPKLPLDPKLPLELLGILVIIKFSL
jgi:hypothetical protein